MTGSAAALVHRDLIIGMAVPFPLPTIFPSWVYVSQGARLLVGLIKLILIGRAAEYVDRILKDAKRPCRASADKVRLVVNLKTADALGITMLLARCRPGDRTETPTSGSGTFRRRTPSFSPVPAAQERTLMNYAVEACYSSACSGA